MEMIQYNSHLYNGEITPTLFVDEELQTDYVLNKLNIDKYKEGNNLLYAIYQKRDALNDEHLHTHPADNDKRQTEAYLITSGYASLNIVRNGKPEVKILKEGDLAIIAPNVAHCVNFVMGEYEQVVTQIPSAFQYGFGFKRNYPMPEGY